MHEVHFLQVFVSGVGFLSDAYVLFVINLVKNVLDDLYKDEMFDNAQSLVGTAALAGAVLGQLVFGGLADRLGRRVIFVCTISFVCLGSVGSALSFAGAGVNIFAQLIVWQVRPQRCPPLTPLMLHPLTHPHTPPVCTVHPWRGHRRRVPPVCHCDV